MSADQPDPTIIPPITVPEGSTAILCMMCRQTVVAQGKSGGHVLAMHIREQHPGVFAPLPPVWSDILSWPTWVTSMTVPGVYAGLISLGELILNQRIAGPWMVLGVGLGSIAASILANWQFRQREETRRQALLQMLPRGFTLTNDGPGVSL